MKITIIGSGTWGTALGQVLLDNGNDVIMYGNVQEQIDDINLRHRNSFYFGDLLLPVKMKGTTDLSLAIKDAEIILLSVPSKALRTVLTQINELLDHKVLFMNTAKGFDTEKNQRLSCLFREVIDEDKMIELVSLIGPSHAEEVIVRDLTAIAAVSRNLDEAYKVAKLFSNQYFRVYPSNDEVGSELGVSYKNAIALASGILEGLKYGDNARAALCTRGLAEMVRFGTHFGANPSTYLGLTGVGDLIVTSYSKHSRNFNAGLKIGLDNSAEAVLNDTKTTIEGVRTVKVIHEIAKEEGLDLPIIHALHKVLFEGYTATSVINALMSRPLKRE